MDLKKRVDIAAGREPADLLLCNGRVVNVFSGEILQADVAIADDFIAGIGDYKEARQVIDLKGRYLLPGFIDGHVHIESTMLTPEGFAEAAVAHGTTAAVADPHEIVNVCGLDGFRYMVEASRDLPLDIFYTIPSCVPATNMETAGGTVGPEEVRKAFGIHPSSPALGEMMNYPGVVHGDQRVLDIIKAAREYEKPVDGHAPLLSGKGLAAYAAAGIYTDHECTSRDEALEKVRAGMKIAIREGTAAQNLNELLYAVDDYNFHHFFFCCDDNHPGDLLEEGGIAHVLRKAVAWGLDPVRAVQLATINTACCYNLKQRGSIAPGYRADMVAVDDLKQFRAELVLKNGEIIARERKTVKNIPRLQDSRVRGTVHLPELQGKLELEVPGSEQIARVIEVFPGQIITRSGQASSQKALQDENICSVAVVERHGKNGNIGLGLVEGFGPLKGALASTVAHDSHNLILLGSSPREMELAAQAVAHSGGGQAVVSGEKVICHFPLPVAGLMSDGKAEEVVEGHRKLKAAAHGIGCNLPDPFMSMSFLALPVIPELKITDQGLVDVNEFRLVSLWINSHRG